MTAATKKVEGFVEDITATTVQVSGKTIFIPPEKRGEFKLLNFAVKDVVKLTYDGKGNFISAELLPPGELPKTQTSPQAKIIDAEAEQKKIHKEQLKAAGFDTSTTPRTTDPFNPVYIQEDNVTGPVTNLQTATQTPPISSPKNVHIDKKDTKHPLFTGNVHIQNENPQNSGKELQTSIPQPPRNMYIQQDTSRLSEREKNNTIILESLLARSVEIVNATYIQFHTSLGNSEFMESLDARCNLIEKVTDRLYDYIKQKVRDEQNENLK